jgi:hypothetical protein
LQKELDLIKKSQGQKLSQVESEYAALRQSNSQSIMALSQVFIVNFSSGVEVVLGGGGCRPRLFSLRGAPVTPSEHDHQNETL